MQIFVAGRLSHFIDGQSTAGCWMSFINCARHPYEQNLVAVQTSETGNCHFVKLFCACICDFFVCAFLFFVNNAAANITYRPILLNVLYLLR